jgi:CheY-like chemotaxis protein/tetratricopeptide (TPR) repeat protein
VALRILIVEDDKHIRKILEQILTRDPSLATRAPEIVMAADGQEGLNALDQGPWDLVISDLLMPRVDGFGFTRELRKHKYGEKVPLIVTSAIYKDAATIHRLQTETGAQFFAKPFQIKEMLAAVRRILDVGGSAGGPIQIAATRPARPDVTPTGQRRPPPQPQAGAIGDRLPPRLLLELFEQKVSGTLTLQRGKVKKDITLVHGSPVAVTSNLRTETLGHFLVTRGVLDESRHQLALRRVQESHERLGQAVVELGWLTESELMKQLGSQMRAKITSVLRWKDGDWLFVPGAPEVTGLQTPVEGARMVLAGLQKTAHVDEIAQTLAPIQGRIALNQRAQRHREAFVRVFGDRGLVALERRPLLEELLVAADPAPMLVQLDALLSCGMAEIERVAVDQRSPQEQTDPIALERLPMAAPGAGEPSSAAERSLYDQLFGDEPSSVGEVPADAPVAVVPLELADSGVVEVPRPVAATAKAAAGARAASAPATAPNAATAPAAPQPAAAAQVATAQVAAAHAAAPHAAAVPPPAGPRAAAPAAATAAARPPAAAAPSPTRPAPPAPAIPSPPLLTTLAVAAPRPDTEEMRAEVLRAYLAMQGKDHYQVLGVARGAPADAIAAAYAALGRRFGLERFADVDLGPDYARVEQIHHMVRAAWDALSTPPARAAYDAELAKRTTRSQAPFDAELLAQKAATRLADSDFAGARELYARAVAAAPDQADYHAFHGWALFHAEGATRAAAHAAWSHLHAAFDIDADHVDAHDFAGRIALVLGDTERALEHLDRVLAAAPARAESLSAFEAACGRRGDHKRLERQYRKLIHRLGSDGAAVGLWWRLAELYRTKLDDRASARVAYETAARLMPDDPRPREALARLLADDPRSWQEAARALRESWRLAPDDPDPGRALFKLHHDAERWDAAYAVAAALAVRGAGDDASQAYLRRLQPRFLVRAQSPLDGAARADGPPWVDQLRHPDDDRDLSQLFARLFAAWQPPFGLPAPPITADDAIELARLPPPFARVLAYTAHQLGVAVPPVYRRADLGADVHVAPARAPLLMVGAQASTLTDLTALAFRLGRALTACLPGRAIAGALPARQLKQTLLAALTVTSPSLRLDDQDGEIARLRGLIAGAGPTLAQQIAPACERILAATQATLSLSRYARGLLRTADRVGLLLCNDLAGALRIVLADGAPGAENDLIDFALSDDYLAARAAVGLSVAV